MAAGGGDRSGQGEHNAGASYVVLGASGAMCVQREEAGPHEDADTACVYGGAEDHGEA